MRNLNNLQTSILPVERLLGEITLLKPLLQRRTDGIFQTQLSGARLVEVLDETNVEVGNVAAEREVHVGEGELVGAVDGDGAARCGPLGAGTVCGFGDVGACGGSGVVRRVGNGMGWEGKRTRPDPLGGRVEGERVTAPLWVEDVEMCGGDGAVGEDLEEGGGKHFGGVAIPKLN